MLEIPGSGEASLVDLAYFRGQISRFILSFSGLDDSVRFMTVKGRPFLTPIFED